MSRNRIPLTEALAGFLQSWIARAEGGETTYTHTEYDCIGGSLRNYLFWKYPERRDVRDGTFKLYREIMRSLGYNHKFPFSYTNHIHRAHSRRMLKCTRRLALVRELLAELDYWE